MKIKLTHCRDELAAARHLRRATGLSLFGLLDCCWATGTGPIAGSTVRALLHPLDQSLLLTPRLAQAIHTLFNLHAVNIQAGGLWMEQLLPERIWFAERLPRGGTDLIAFELFFVDR